MLEPDNLDEWPVRFGDLLAGQRKSTTMNGEAISAWEMASRLAGEHHKPLQDLWHKRIASLERISNFKPDSVQYIVPILQLLGFPAHKILSTIARYCKGVALQESTQALGTLLGSIRNEQKLTLQQVNEQMPCSSHVRMSIQTLTKIENFRRPTSPEECCALLSFYGCTKELWDTVEEIIYIPLKNRPEEYGKQEIPNAFDRKLLEKALDLEAIVSHLPPFTVRGSTRSGSPAPVGTLTRPHHSSLGRSMLR